MELDLGLALPSNQDDDASFAFRQDFDLNACVSEPSKPRLCLDDRHNRAVPRTLPLLFWNDQPNEDQDPPRDLDDDPSVPVDNRNDEVVVVGWPPIKSWRKVVHRRGAGRFAAPAGNGCRRAGPDSKYVKVKMEGVVIARKIDLSLYDSYRALVDTLTRRMFHIYRGNNSVDDYELVYQDKEGDWLLAADAPWRTFMRNAQRLKLARRSNGMS